METDAIPEVSDSDLLTLLFGTCELKEAFGTDDPIEIIATLNPDQIRGSDPKAGYEGFEEEAQEIRDIVILAQEAQSRLEKNRSTGSLEFLAEKLGKTSRQVREYCKEGRVPGAFQTAGGQWRIKYVEDTVAKTLENIGEFSRRRSDNWLTARLRGWFESTPPPSYPEETVLPPTEKVQSLKPKIARIYSAAIELTLRGVPVTVKAIAKKVGCTRRQVTRDCPALEKALSLVQFFNSGLLDLYNEEINRRNGLVRTMNYDTAQEVD